MKQDTCGRKFLYLSLGSLAAAILAASVFHYAEAEPRQETFPTEDNFQGNDPFVTDTSATDAPVTDTPVTDTPVTDTPVTDTPVTDTPVTDTPVTDVPATDAPETEPLPIETNWYIVLSDIAPVIPEGGRIYDGTDQISVNFRWRLIPQMSAVSGKEDKSCTDSIHDTDISQKSGTGQTSGENSEEKADQTPPQVTVTCTAHLASPHAGIQAVLYDFQYQTDDPVHVFMAADNPHPELTVDILKRILTVEIPDGRKVFAEKADMDHIWPDESTDNDMNQDSGDRETGKVPQDRHLKARVSGFLTDQNGNPVIPSDFQAPDVAVDNSVLKTDSPMFQYGRDEENEEQDGKKARDTDSGREAVYQNALVMKRNKEGGLSGNATADYAFCEDPSDPRYHCGSVRIVSSKVKEGEDYTVEGPSLVREGGRLIIRSGSSLYVRVKNKSPYNTGIEKSDLQSDGRQVFRLKKVDRDGHVLAESLPEEISWKVDGQVPAASISISGGHQEDDRIFSDSACAIRISVSQDAVSGMYQVLYRIRSGSTLPSGQNLLPVSGFWNQADLSGYGEVRVSEEGIFQAEVMTQDRVGNTAYALSQIFVIDRTKPDCTIRGVSDGSANSGEVRLDFACRDRFYRKDSAQYSMTSVFGGKVPAELSRRQTSDGILIRLADFERTKDADAWYHVSFRAEDMAGNVSSQDIDFSVNRFGSSYGISAETSKRLETYYHRRPFDITFLESNLDQVSSTKALVMRNGKKQSGIKFQPEEVTGNAGENDGLHHYIYTIPADTFRKDGRYEVILMTSDRAGNSADTEARRFPVRFAIDHEKPECLVSGIKNKGTYRAASLTLSFEVRDNLAPDSAEVYLNTHLLKSYSASEIRKADGVFKISLRENPAWQRLQFHVIDQAGNEYWTDEYLVFLSEEEDTPADQDSGDSAEQLAEKEKREKKENEHRRKSGVHDREDAGDTEAEAESSSSGQESGILQSAAELLKKTETEWRSPEDGSGKAAGPEEELPVKKKRDRNGAALVLVFAFVITYAGIYAIKWFRSRRQYPGGRKDG